MNGLLEARTTQTAASITAIAANVVLTEFEFMAHPLSWRARHDGVAPTDYLLIAACDPPPKNASEV
jgi:hypothetical protein